MKASTTWSGPKTDVLRVWVEPTPIHWIADPFDGESALLVVMDEDGRETGDVAGVEVIGISDFDRWDELPELPILWQLPGEKPLPLDELLKKKQRELRERADVPTSKK